MCLSSWQNQRSLAAAAPAKRLPLTDTRTLLTACCNLKAVEYQLIAFLASLQSLVLHRNKIAEVPAFTFSAAGKLEVISLRENQLTSIGKGAFSGLQQLHSLDISSNMLRAMSPACLKPLAGTLETLALSKNQLTSAVLEAGLLWSLGKVSSVSLDGNQLDAITVAAFHDLTNLHKLVLGSNPISFIEVGALNTMSRLQILSMASTKLTALNAGVFHGTALEQIMLDGSRIAQVDPGVFLDTVRTIGMHGNPTDCALGYHHMAETEASPTTLLYHNQVVPTPSCLCARGYHSPAGASAGASCRPKECSRRIHTGEQVQCPPNDPLRYQVGGAPCSVRCFFGATATVSVTCGVDQEWESDRFVCGGLRAIVGA